MRLVGLRQLYRNLGKELKDLPFLITNHNKTVAVVVSEKRYIKMIRNCIEKKEKDE